MSEDNYIDELKARRICYECIGEEYLRAEVQREGLIEHCSYCGHNMHSYLIGELAERVEKAFEQHFSRTSDQPTSWQQSLLSDRESDYDWERDGESVVWAIANAADIQEPVAQDIQTILDDQYADFDTSAIGEETEFCSESYYEEKGSSDYVWQEEWRDFERSLKAEARFFSRTAAKHLASVFGRIDEMFSTDGRPLVIDAGPQTNLTSIYRARVFQSEKLLREALCRPDLHIGSPPAVLASAGRMNARGISVFYGATETDVAIAEVRPPVGSQVVVACFELIRPVRLLDLTALGTVVEGGSIFDPKLAARLERATFLRSLSQRIVQPVMPDDEVFEYLPTQAIADFLATENEPLLDGILFPSVQATGSRLNIVLFHKAARVETMDIPERTEINANTGYMTEDGMEVDFSVIERVPPQSASKDNGGQWNDVEAFSVSASRTYNIDPRHVTLRIDPQSIKVHVVRRVRYECDEHDVSRHRFDAASIEERW